MKQFILALLFLPSSYANALEAFGAPGAKPNWAPASKTHIGTAYNTGVNSPIWFTSSQGILTEVYFPTVDTAQIKDAQLLISDGNSFFVQEKDLTHKNQVLTAAENLLINSDQKNRFSITHNYFTDPNSPVLFDEITIHSHIDGLKFYLLANPHINNSGFNDTAKVDDEGFIIHENQTKMSIRSSVGFRKKSVGFVGSSDGYQDLATDLKMDFDFTSATNGNTAATGELNIPAVAGQYRLVIAYNFSSTSNLKMSHIGAIDQMKAAYFGGWNQYILNLKTPKNLSYDESLLYFRSLYTLKCHEDKVHPGAIIASISIPWGEQQFDSPGMQIGGYHLVWPRDLYNIASALLYAGDRETAVNALRFLKNIQFQSHSGNWYFHPRVISKKGAFPQNVWVNGSTYWEGFQIDQTGYPVLLFGHIYSLSSDREKAELMAEFRPMLTDALNFILTNGPWTQEERWEENFGISPSSFSGATAALLFGAKIFNDDFGYRLKTAANLWLTKPNDNIDSWTFTTNGFYGDGSYYLRIAGGNSFDAPWDPNANVTTHIANSNHKVDQRKLLDQGFLQLSLLGLKPASDEKIKKSKTVIDDNISIMTPNGRAYYRYSFDAYGENNQGRLWPLLSGEHARYYIERYRKNDMYWSDAVTAVNQVIDSLFNFANDGLMIPEQVYERTGEGTGSATPLAWAHAEYIKLLWSKEYQRNIENILN